MVAGAGLRRIACGVATVAAVLLVAQEVLARGGFSRSGSASRGHMGGFSGGGGGYPGAGGGGFHGGGGGGASQAESGGGFSEERDG